ncbi:MAG: class I SAM-dependent methyltransferase, partial [Opitutae bacterium]|nr:class I SAM-dependent methyltransferase [Opitutae bacterium]
MDSSLEEEAHAFDQRIESRVDNGFIPDLRKLKHNPFFYKSFWRDPYFTKLYLGDICNNFIEKLAKHTSLGARVLDLGCGAGYLALEIARQGYHVTGVDISESCINIANKTLDETDIRGEFGSLEYQNGSVSELSMFNQFDAVICSGVLHHLEPLPEALVQIRLSLKTGGALLWHEPQHQYWTKTEASIVTLIRLILANLNMWHDEEVKGVGTRDQLLKMIDEVYEEYRYERDPDEKKG